MNVLPHLNSKIPLLLTCLYSHCFPSSLAVRVLTSGSTWLSRVALRDPAPCQTSCPRAGQDRRIAARQLVKRYVVGSKAVAEDIHRMVDLSPVANLQELPRSLSRFPVQDAVRIRSHLLTIQCPLMQPISFWSKPRTQACINLCTLCAVLSPFLHLPTSSRHGLLYRCLLKFFFPSTLLLLSLSGPRLVFTFVFGAQQCNVHSSPESESPES